MTKQEKIEAVETLYNELESSPCFYVANSEGLNVGTTNTFRKHCFEKKIRYKVVKNTLIKKTLERLGNKEGITPEKSKSYTEFADQVLKGFSGLLITNEVNGVPAKLIKNFRKEIDSSIPGFKGAYVDGDFFIGEEHLEVLSNLKTKEELIGDVINLLQSPIKNILSAINSGKHTLAGLLKTLSERPTKKE
ncbi:MAG: 50S ribosomal protein L10 [Bacteroidetes bacterium]|nr:50S ribosomal protein L10 [Bacteroidota bacterium]